MTHLTLSQPNMIFHRIFEIGPRIQSLVFTSDEVEKRILRISLHKLKQKSEQIAD